MTEVISLPTGISELLAPATPAAAGRGPAGGFELLIALLQAGIAPAPTPIDATLVMAGPIAAPGLGSVSQSPLALDAAVAPAPSATPSSQASHPVGLGAVISSLARDEGIGLRAKDDADPDDQSSTGAPEAVAAALLVAATVTTLPLGPDGVAKAPDGSATANVEDGVPALKRARAFLMNAPTDELAELSSGSAPLGDAPLVEGTPGGASTPEPLAPSSPAIAAGLEPRAGFERSARTVDAFRHHEAVAPPESVREDVAQRLAAATSMMRAAAGRDGLADRSGLPLSEREPDGNAPSVESVLTAAPTAGSAMALRDAAAVTESARPDVARDPVDQIVTHLRDVKTPGRHELSVRLDPPELGAVRIDARLDGPRLHLEIRAEHLPTGELLAEALPRLRETLSQQGFIPTDVTVHLGLEGSGRHLTRDDAPTFTPPRDGETTTPVPAVHVAAARAAMTSDGLDVWA